MLVQLAEGEVPNSNKNGMWPNLLPLFSDVQIKIIHRILAWVRSAKSPPLLRTHYGLLINVGKSDNNNNNNNKNSPAIVVLTFEAEKQAC